jgi:hypothetical protein
VAYICLRLAGGPLGALNSRINLEMGGPSRLPLAHQRSAMTQYETCRHVKEDGAYCGSPALRERKYCYYPGKAGYREGRGRDAGGVRAA